MLLCHCSSSQSRLWCWRRQTQNFAEADSFSDSYAHTRLYIGTRNLSLSLSLSLSLCSADYGYALLTPSRKRVVLLRCFLVACMVSRAREFGLGWSEPYNKTKLCFSPTFKDLSLSLSVFYKACHTYKAHALLLLVLSSSRYLEGCVLVLVLVLVLVRSRWWSVPR